MAGLGSNFSLTGTGSYGATHNGRVWDPKVGAYVSPTAPGTTGAINAANTASSAVSNATAATAMPMSLASLDVLKNNVATSAPGYVKPMTAAEAANAALGTGTLSETARANQSDEALARDKFSATKAMRDSLMSTLGGVFGGGGGAPGGGGGGTGMPMTMVDPAAAEAAALTSSKERGGERLASSLKGLHELMAERGISGSGIEAGDTRALFNDYMHDQNDTERGLVQQRTQRAQNVADAEWARANSVEDRNYQGAQQLTHDKITALLQSFGLAY